MARSNAPLSTISAKVADELISELNADLQDSAVKHGWPQDVASSLSIKNDNGNISIDYPDSMSNIINDLEYGTGTSYPTAVMRKFKWRNEAKITQLTIDAYAEWFSKTGGGAF